MSADPPQPVTVKLDWTENVNEAAQHVNQVLGQIGAPSSSGVPDGVYVTLGSVQPPIIPADPEGRQRAIEALMAEPVKVAVYGRFQMSREILGDLIKVLQSTAEQYDAAVREADNIKRPVGR